LSCFLKQKTRKVNAEPVGILRLSLGVIHVEYEGQVEEFADIRPVALTAAYVRDLSDKMIRTTFKTKLAICLGFLVDFDLRGVKRLSSTVDLASLSRNQSLQLSMGTTPVPVQKPIPRSEQMHVQRARIDKQALIDLLIELFQEKEHWKFNDLMDRTDQPRVRRCLAHSHLWIAMASRSHERSL